MLMQGMQISLVCRQQHQSCNDAFDYMTMFEKARFLRKDIQQNGYTQPDNLQ